MGSTLKGKNLLLKGDFAPLPSEKEFILKGKHEKGSTLRGKNLPLKGQNLLSSLLKRVYTKRKESEKGLH